MTLKRQYRCTFCEKTFTRESWYKKHMCTKKERFIKSNDITVISAHRLFNHWQRREKLLRRGKEKTMDEFTNSPYYNLFVKLAEFTAKTNVVSAYTYVNWLVDHKVKEFNWCPEDNSKLQEYYDYLRSTEDPAKQAQDTCENIKHWCESKGIDPDTFFKKITPGQALNMVRSNELSPWVLFGYQPSLEQLWPRIEDEVLFSLDDHINVNYWLDKVDKEKENIDVVTEWCEKNLRDGTAHRNT